MIISLSYRAYGGKDKSMSRVENIAKYAQKKEEERTAKELNTTRQIEEYKEKIKALKPRIDELLEVGNACLEYGIPLEGKEWGGHEGYDTNQFITNSWSHLLGFVAKSDRIMRNDRIMRKRLPFTHLGIMGGGACNYNLKTDGVTVEVSGQEFWVLKAFIDRFDIFEEEFYKYVDKVTAKVDL